MVRVSEGSSYSQAGEAKAAHSYAAPSAASLGSGNPSLAQNKCSGIAAASTRENRELCSAGSSAKCPIWRTRGAREIGGVMRAAEGCRAAFHSHPHDSHVAAHSITALMAPGSKEVPPHSDAPSRYQAHIPLYLSAP